MRFFEYFENNLPETYLTFCVAKILLKNRNEKKILFGENLPLILVVFDIIKQKLAQPQEWLH